MLKRRVDLQTSKMLDALQSDVDHIIRRVRTRFSGLDGPSLNWAPVAGKWSVGRCLDHLIVANGLYLERIEPAMAEARARGLTDPGLYRGGAFGQWFRRQMEPGRGRFKVPRVFRPTDGEVSEFIVDSFLTQQEEVKAVIERGRDLDLAAIKIPSPVTAMLRFRVGDALGIVVAHERRHIAQAERVAAAVGFPGR